MGGVYEFRVQRDTKTKGFLIAPLQPSLLPLENGTWQLLLMVFTAH